MRSSAKRAHVTELIETCPGPSAQQQAEASTEQPLMAINMQALTASISNAVQQAVAEAMKAQWPAAPSQDTQSTTDQSVANVVNASLAENTQGTPPCSDNIFKTHSVNLGFKTSFFPKIVTGPFNTRHNR